MRKIKPSFIEANLGYEVIEVEFVPSDDSPVIKPLVFFNNASSRVTRVVVIPEG
jgi:hypothetical protein